MTIGERLYPFPAGPPQFPRETLAPPPPNWLLAYAINYLLPYDLPDDPFDPTAWLNTNERNHP